MRQFFFAIVLVAAAFGGGAMVNGPGFRWAQDHLFDYMGLKDGGEIATIDLPPAPTDENALDAAPAARSSEPPRTDARPDQKTELKPSEPVAAEPTAQPAPQPSPPPATPSATAPPPLLAGPSGSPGPAPSAPPAPLDPGVAPALLAALSPAPAPAPHSPAPDLDPVPAVETKPASAPTSGGGDWAELRGKLKAQGVTQYRVEVDIQGRAVFSCLIPLAGKQAVSQRFEADGDDEFAAANAALRRIKLWRATQTPAPAS